MTDLNPILLNSFNPMQGESVQNIQGVSQPSDFTRILSGLFANGPAGAQTGMQGETSARLPALQKLVKFLSQDELQNLPPGALNWQDLPPQGNALPALDWINWLHQVMPDTGANPAASEFLQGEGGAGLLAATTGSANPVKPGPLVNPAVTHAGTDTGATETSFEWLDQLTRQQLDVLKSNLAAARTSIENAPVQTASSESAVKSLNDLLQQVMGKLQLAERQNNLPAHELPGIRMGENINPVQASLLSSQKEFKDFLKSSGSNVSDFVLKLAGRAGADVAGANFHTGLESQLKAGAESLLHKADAATGTLTMQHALGKPGWATELGDKVIWMGKQDIKSAFLRLNPGNLGPVEVRVSIHQDQTHVSFIAHQPQAREALEASIPRLREMMDAGGFNLGNVDVSGRSPHGQQGNAAAFAQQQGQNQSHHAFRQGEEDELPQLETLIHASSLANGTNSVDFFA